MKGTARFKYQCYQRSSALTLIAFRLHIASSFLSPFISERKGFKTQHGAPGERRREWKERRFDVALIPSISRPFAHPRIILYYWKSAFPGFYQRAFMGHARLTSLSGSRACLSARPLQKTDRTRTHRLMELLSWRALHRSTSTRTSVAAIFLGT